jgi:hypothetical protein
MKTAPPGHENPDLPTIDRVRLIEEEFLPD